MNICVVGCGAIAQKHMEAFAKIEGVTPYMLVGRREEPAREFARQWQFKNHTLDFEQALEDLAIDAVVITSPNALHPEHAIKALSARKHVLLEIPMALNLTDSKTIAEVAQKSGKKLMIAHTMRYFPAIKELRKRVEEQSFKIHHITGFFGLSRRSNTTSSGNSRSWTDDILWHFGAHMVDVVLWVCRYKEVKSVNCQFGAKHPTQGFLDMSLIMKMPGDEVFTLAQSYNVDQFRWQLTFIGEEETLEFDMGVLRDTKGSVIVPQSSITDLFEQDKEFIESILQNRTPAIGAEDILPTMEILQQAENKALSEQG